MGWDKYVGPIILHLLTGTYVLDTVRSTQAGSLDIWDQRTKPR